MGLAEGSNGERKRNSQKSGHCCTNLFAWRLAIGKRVGNAHKKNAPLDLNEHLVRLDSSVPLSSVDAIEQLEPREDERPKFRG